MNDLYSHTIRALSWKEPFASLMLLGKIETRTWDTDYRGLVLICASKMPYSECQIMKLSGERLTQKALVTLLEGGVKENPGHAIAIGTLVETRRMTKEDEDQCFVQYHPSLYCHIYTDVRPIIPIQWKGQQGWRTLGVQDARKIRFKNN